MAFVFRSDKNCSYIAKPITEQIGPGHYEEQTEQERQNAHAFNSSSEKWAKQKKPTPGPGAYNIASQDAQKVIFQSEENEIKILEVPKPISVFRSTTQRFKETRYVTPGPDQYFQEQQRQKTTVHRNRKPNIIDQLMQVNKYQSIPSIPGPVHKFGYSENNNSELMLNMNIQPKPVGPGAYDIPSQFTRPRGVTWHAPSKQIDPHSQIGPGTYNIDSNTQPMYQMKPTTAFSSKMERSNEFRFRQTNSVGRKEVTKRGLNNKQYSFQMSTNAGSRDSDEESEYSFIEDSTPGPGSYDISQTSTIVKGVPLKNGAKRFKPTDLSPGPGAYRVDYVPRVRRGPRPPFQSSDLRFKEKIIEGPDAYDCNITMEKQLIAKLQKAPLGEFGVNEERFKMPSQGVPGPGTYESALPHVKPITSVFKSTTKQTDEILLNSIAPPPGAYDLSYLSLANKVKKQDEDDPHLAVIKPGFMVGEKRWKETVIKEEDEEEPQYQDKITSELYKKYPRNQPPFQTREQRFKELKAFVPGPGEYSDQSTWNKRTFNIIFAEI